MTRNHENTSDIVGLTQSAASSLLPLLTGGGEGRFRDALELLLNASMLLERQQHLRAEPHARSEERDGHANGFKDRSLQTRLGELNLRVPQVRGSSAPFYPQSLERGVRSRSQSRRRTGESF